METTTFSLAKRLLEPEVMVFLVPIVLIVVGGAVKIARMMIAHRERMSLIEMGIHPDFPPDEAPVSVGTRR